MMEQVGKRLDDYIKIGPYVVCVCILAELMILPQVSSMVYMMYAGASPKLDSCENGITFDSILEEKEICTIYHQINSNNCSSPSLKYQFRSVNVEWKHFCDNSKLIKNSISIQMLGVLVGSLVFGQISDLYGRRKMMLFTTTGMAVAWVFVAKSVTLTQFTVARTIVGFFCGGSIAVLNVFIMENIPKRHRMWINMAITWSPNMPPIALFAWLTQEWRLLAMLNAFVCLPGILFCFLFIRESPRWLIHRGKTDEATDIMRTKFCRGKAGEEVDNVVLNEYELARRTETKKRKYSIHHLFYSRKLAVTTTVLAFSYFSTSIVNYCILFNLEKLSGSLYLNSVYSGLMRYACNLMCGYADYKWKRIGRKFVHTSGLVLIITSLTIVIFAYAFGLNHILKDEIRVCVLIASSMTSQVYIADGIVGNELYPTPIRNLGYSFLQLWNRAGVVISPFAFYSADIWVAFPYCIMCLLCIIDTVAFECLLPETKGKPLVEHMPGPEQKLLRGRKHRYSKGRMEGLVAAENGSPPL